MFQILHPGSYLAILAGALCPLLYRGLGRGVALASDFPWCINLSRSQTVPTTPKYSPLKFKSNGKGAIASGQDTWNPSCACPHFIMHPNLRLNGTLSWKEPFSLELFEAYGAIYLLTQVSV